MVTRKKPYRKVSDRNFLLIADMPLVDSREEAIQWLKTSEVVRYVFKLCRKEFALIASKQSDDSYLWNGINYQEENREWIIDDRTGYAEKVTEAICKDEIDLMPSLRHKFPDKRFDLFKSEVVQFLVTKKYIWELILITAAYNGILIRNEDGTWCGKNLLKETNTNKC